MIGVNWTPSEKWTANTVEKIREEKYRNKMQKQIHEV